MNELYPIFLVIMSLLLGVAVFFCFRTNKASDNDNMPKAATETIDKLINNSNSGISVIQYRKALNRYDIKYIAWRANRNGPSK